MNIADQNYIADPSVSFEDHKYGALNHSYDPTIA
jgi:hypothetical protein